jgi:hypothetical protein
MILRPEHFAAFATASQSQFEENMMIFLRERFPEETTPLSNTDLRRLVREGTDRARRYNIEGKPDVPRFLECMIVYGYDFDTNPKTNWAGQILRTPSLTGSMKMDAIDEFGKRQRPNPRASEE